MATPPTPRRTAMRMKLAFSHGGSDVFRVHVVPRFESSKNAQGGEYFVVPYTDKGVFLDLLAQADIDPIQHAQIVGSIAALALSPGSMVCCDGISLNEHQLHILLNGAVRTRTV